VNNLIIGTALNDHVRFYLLNSKEIVNKTQKLFNMYPTSLAALGRTLSVTAIMGSMLKGKEETVTTIINGGGAIGTIMAVANGNNEVKGFCGDPHIYLKYNSNNKLAVGLAVGKEGYLKVIKDLKLKDNYSSQVNLQSGEIGDDFSYYFNVSEQRPSIVSVGVLVDKDYSCKSGGALIIELLPNAEEEDIVYLENLASKLEPISNVLDNDDDLKKYINSLFEDAKVLEERSVNYVCDCSKERFKRNLLTLPLKDLEELSKDEKVEVVCEFCNETYTFTPDEIKQLMTYVKNR